MGNIVGIDLGTTNSVAAFKLAQVEVVTAADNTPPDRKLTQSVVAFHQNRLVAGQEAYNQLRANPENVVISIKRLMGRSFAEPEVQEQLSRFGYKITQTTHGTENSLSVWIGEQEYRPEDISAEILKKMVQNAQNFQNQQGQSSEITEAVITIPAYFNDKQRHATRSAALRAGLKLRELLPEPTAAAISYGFTPDQSDEVKTILVYDFGGGTFDASLLSVSGHQFIELGKAGNLWLGGDDIDQKMIEFVKKQVSEQENLNDVGVLISNMPNFQRIRFLADLKIAVESAKVVLSNASTVRIIPPTPLLNELGMPIFIDVEITRDHFEQLITPIIDRTIPICYDAVYYGDYTIDLVDVVLLVGGSSQIPIVQQKVKEAFGTEKVVVHPRPMYAVAEGAAIVAAGLTDKVGTISRDYYIKLVDGLHKVISRGEILPFSTAQTFKTVADGQRLINLEFFNRDDERNIMESIGKMWLPLYQSYAKETEILVTLELDERVGNLQITAVLKNDPSVKMSSLFSRGGTDEKINENIDQIIQDINSCGYSVQTIETFSQEVMRTLRISNQIVDSLTGKEREDIRQQAFSQYEALQNQVSQDYQWARFWVYECEHIVQAYGFLLHPDQQRRLSSLAQNLREAMDNNNLSALQTGLESVRKEMAILPQEIQKIQTSSDAINIANQISPLQGQAMNDKKELMVAALQRGEPREAERIWSELLPEIQYWLNQKLPTATIETRVQR